ncbi:hypothetical protein [Fulvivirga lutea]|uniref:TonB-dependent receptor plug domain-containing protein n=1 Tax=Fulvivirga lutea TaxID=2810512 RepID=A0A975A184_9BACT|nr:hypothetical protein [Fulvivirga lutea]QSE97257.1 hypothetical protein JR347_16950 [Fulvivirga lutea]
MKKLLVMALILMPSVMIAKKQTDLYDKIKGIMLTELDYVYDSTSNKPKSYINGPTEKESGLPHTYSSIPDNPSPLVVLNGDIKDMEELKKYDSNDIKSIEIFKPDNTKVALYGLRGTVKGVILITTNP